MRVRARTRPATLYSHPGARFATPEFLRPRPSRRMTRHARRILGIPLALAVATLAGFCDDGILLIVPELERTFSFESGLDGWSPLVVAASSSEAAGGVEVSGEEASSGQRSARFHLSAPEAGPAVVVQHLFELAPSQGYRIEVSYRVAMADPSGGPTWSIVGGAGPEAEDAGGSGPSLAALGSTGPAGADGRPAWESRVDTLRATSSDQGELWVVLGVSAQSGGERTYYADDLRLAFVREGGG